MASQYSILRNYGKYVSPYNMDVMMQGMGYMQQKIDTNRQAINEYADYIINSDIIKPQDREYLQNRLNGLIQDVNNVYRKSNLASDGIARSIQARLGEALDTRVLNAIAGTREIRSFSEKMEDMKLNNPKMYSPINEAEAFADAVAWMNDGQVGTRLNPIHYTPYTDYHAEIDEKMKNFISLNKGKKVNVPVVDANGNRTGEMREMYIDEMSYAQARDIAMASISENGKAQMQLEGRYMARTNPDLFNVQSTSDFLKGYIDDFSVKEESIRAKLKGVGNDKAKRAKLESELADIIKQRNDFVEEAEGVIGSNYSPERAGMFMVRQQFLRGVGLRWSYNNSYETLGVDDYYFKANQQMMERAKFNETKRHNLAMEKAALIKASKSGKSKNGGGDDDMTGPTVVTKSANLDDVSISDEFMNGFIANEKAVTTGMGNFVKLLSDDARRKIDAWASDPENSNVVKDMDNDQVIMAYFKANGGSRNELLDYNGQDSYLKLLGLNTQRGKYNKINDGFNKASNAVLDGIDTIIQREARSDSGSGIDISYGFGTFNLGDINNNGDKVFDINGINDITLNDWSKLSAYSSLLNDNINTINYGVEGEMPHVSMDSGQSGVLLDRVNDLMGTSFSLDDIESIMSLAVSGANKNRHIEEIKDRFAGDNRAIAVATAIYDEAHKERNDLLRHKWSRGDLGRIADDAKRAGEDYLRQYRHEYAEREYIFSGDYPSKSKAEYDYIKISDLFTRGGGFIPKDEDNANKKITFTISPIGDGNYQIIGNNGGDGRSVVEVSEADLAANDLTFYKEDVSIPSETYDSGVVSISFANSSDNAYGKMAKALQVAPVAYASGAKDMTMPYIDMFTNINDGNIRKNQMMIATDVLFDNASMYELRASGYKYNNGSSGINVDIYSKGGAREGNTPLYSIDLDGVNYADEVARKIDFCPQYYLVMAWQQILSKENEVYWRSEGRSTTDDFESFISPIASMIDQEIRNRNNGNSGNNGNNGNL
nr:MAG TPA: hypothetical protein [Crassvirales sp.]